MAKKKRKNKQSEVKLDKFIVFMTIALFILLIVWIIKDNKKPDVDSQPDAVEKAGIKSFNKIDLKEALNAIKNDELTFIYIGYEGCAPCDAFAPILATISKGYDMKVNYMDIHEIDKDSKEWKTFTDKLNKTVDLSTKSNDKTKKETKTIGKFLYENGYTPTLVVLKSNKIVDGHVGGFSADNLKTFLDDAGFEKNS